MSSKVIKAEWSLDKIIEELSYELADPHNAQPYDKDRQIILTYGSLYRILKAIQKTIKENN